MPITRRTLIAGAIVGGAAAGTGLLAGCSSGDGAEPTVGAGGAGGAGGTPDVATVTKNELRPLRLFNSDEFNDKALFTLGAASSHTGEVGEAIRIVQAINGVTRNPGKPREETFDAYYRGFGEYADGLETLAAEAGKAHRVTARNRYLRSSHYAAQQLFFVLGTSDGAREESIYDVCASRFSSAMSLFTPKPISFKVDSPWGKIPGLFFTQPGKDKTRPTVIISEGSDGQNVETMQFGVTAALARGYNVVLFEGPGQMSLLFKRMIPFTPDWDLVVGPVLKWVRKRPEVGKVALIGISFGGMLCARAGAKLKGLDALVLEPAAWSFPNMWPDQKTMDTVRDTYELPTQEKAKAAQEVNDEFLQAWPSLPRLDQFNIYKRGEIMQKKVQKEARAGAPVSDYYGLLESMLPYDFAADFRAIAIPTLVTANQGDEFFGYQSVEAFNMLENAPRPQTQLISLTAAQGAQLHDQPTGPQVAEEAVFDWLDDQLS